MEPVAVGTKKGPRCGSVQVPNSLYTAVMLIEE